MMNKKLIIVFLLFLNFYSIAQGEKKINAKVIDSVTKEPIINAHIIGTESTQGIYTDTNGSFYYSLDKKDTIQISHVSYKNKLLTVNELTKQRDIIYLSPSITKLNEVYIDKNLIVKKNKLFYINKFKKVFTPQSPNLFKSSDNFWIPYRENNTNYEAISFVNDIPEKLTKLKGIIISLSRWNKEKQQAEALLHILEYDAIKKIPGKDIFPPIPLEITKTSEEVNIDLEIYEFDFPENGIVIGIEYIKNKENSNIFKNESNEVVKGYSPYLNFFNSKKKSSYSPYGYWVHNDQKWIKISRRDAFQKNSFWKPAITLILSKQ